MTNNSKNRALSFAFIRFFVIEVNRVKLSLPFTKGKVLDLSFKQVNQLYSLRTHNPIGLEVSTIGMGDGFGKSEQNEQDLIDEGYGSNVLVYSIIKDIATCGADIPKVLYDLNNPEEPIEEGDLYDVLQMPGKHLGEELSQYEYFETLITYLLSSGNIYQRGLKSVGFGDIWQQLEIIPTGIVTPYTHNSYFDGVKWYEINDKAEVFRIAPDELIHTKYINPTTYGLEDGEGLSPLQAALYSLTGSNDIQKAISVMVKNQGARGIISSTGDRVMTPEQAEALGNRFDNDYLGVKNFSKPKITNASIDYTQIGMSSSDLQVIDSGVLTDRQLCNAYGVSSRLYNDPANSTYNNMKEANKAFYTKAVIPTLNKILMDYNQGFLKGWSMRDGKKYCLKLDTSEVEALQADQKEEAEKDKTQLEGVQIIVNLPISDEGKKALLVKTYGFTEELADSVVNNSQDGLTE